MLPDTTNGGPSNDGAGSEKEPVEPARGVTHEPTGLGLAREIANSVAAGSKGRRRRRRPARSPDPSHSGAHPDDRDPQPLSAAMGRLVDSKGWSREINVHVLLGRWPVLVGPTNAAHSAPVGYTDTVLTVRADSTVWATSLRSMAPQLVAKLNAELGDGTVTSVKVLGPEAPSWKKGRLSVRDGRGPRDTYG
ncbi:DUF721 family protein [Microlunatus panaciterrae]|uniref:Nucleic acid-binding Zn ribbon protein n=1 Tax=Microlunatus panaciterrae TaxID=400768 RepID=A0ABS2RIU6_9ACTN|nr:DciA family protein [Microlunatus panaciterrae]MBM7798930.1 putative nucleic acid-binding Zn ribbon protein [Microlunatus panaciterrae]